MGRALSRSGTRASGTDRLADAAPSPYWSDAIPAPGRTRPALAGDSECDVAIVGAGYTGMWTAYYLTERDPTLRISILEAERAGFGASGRNGGWCSGLFPVAWSRVARASGTEGARALRLALEGSIDEVGAVAAREQIDCDFAKGGTVLLARGEAQLARARAEVAEARELGIGGEDLRLLSRTETLARVGATGVLGATFTPHCAALHPAKLVHGLAGALERRGVTIYERTPVRAVTPGAARTARGTVRAHTIVIATEGYGTSLRPRQVMPVYSLMLATEPLGEEIWEQIGLAARETFADHRHLIVYGQRSADGRICFGGRGAPYHLGSAVRPAFDQNRRVHASLVRSLVELFPALASVAITHRWGGALAIARDWHPSVGLDPTTRIAWAGGYAGDGVAATNLAGRTLAELISGEDGPLGRLPWVGHRSPPWEPEPLRWLGVNALLSCVAGADRSEARHQRPARRMAAISRLLGD